jgi:hypothetical protein
LIFGLLAFLGAGMRLNEVDELGPAVLNIDAACPVVELALVELIVADVSSLTFLGGGGMLDLTLSSSSLESSIVRISSGGRFAGG